MTTERTAEEWGRVAVSLPGWRWMPGMGLFPLESYVRQNERDGEHTGEYRYAGHTKDGEAVTHIRPSKVRKHVNLATGHYHPPHAYFVPNPGDPATAGCLLALLGSWVTVTRSRSGGYIVHVAGPDGPVFGTGSTLGRACIAAAAALGRWPGGEQ